MEKINIIMGVYDEPVNVLKRTIDFVFSQDFENFKMIICIDNPNNIQVIEFLSKLKEVESKRLEYIINETNIGLGFSLNRCIQLCNAKYIARIDADDTCDNKRFTKQYEKMEENKEIDLLFTGYNIIKKDKTIDTPSLPENATFEKHFFNFNPFKHGTLMAKTTIYKKYMYNISHAPEDYEMYFRMYKEGVSFRLLNEPLYNHFKFEKDSYRLNVDTFLRHSKMSKFYNSLLLNNFFVLYRCRGYYATLFKTFKERLLFSNYTIYKFLKKVKNSCGK